MPQFSERSKRNLAQCDEKLQILFNTVIKYYDCTVICGFRNEADQNEDFENGKSKLQWPNSKHNKLPSKAVDVIAFPINWSDTKKHIHFGGFVQGMAEAMGIKIRWGGDFNMNGKFDDRFFDAVHFELID